MPSEFFVVQALDFLGLVRTHSRAAKLERKDDIPYHIYFWSVSPKEKNKTYSVRDATVRDELQGQP